LARAFCVVNFPLTRGGRVALPLPGIDFGGEHATLSDLAIQTLTAQNTYFDSDHVQPARVFRRVMKLQALKNAVCFSMELSPSLP
jgi:hypothetical protein